MKKSLRHLPHRTRGAVAVEFAFLLIFILPFLLAAVLFFGRYFWYYTVAEKAALDAARFLATASPADFKTFGPDGVPPIVTAAKLIGQKTVEGLRPGPYPALVRVYCNKIQCTALEPVPQNITVRVSASVEDLFFPGISAAFMGGSPAIPINAVASISYVGN